MERFEGIPWKACDDSVREIKRHHRPLVDHFKSVKSSRLKIKDYKCATFLPFSALLMTHEVRGTAASHNTQWISVATGNDYFAPSCRVPAWSFVGCVVPIA